jgi:UDP-glucose 4-epimerase
MLLDGAESAALNIGTGRGWSVRDLIDCARQVANRDILVRVGLRGPAILQY